MKKIYISPAIDIYNVIIHSGIMGSPETAGSEVDIEKDLNDLNPGVGGNPGGDGGWDDEDNSRDNNRGSVWDNIW